MPLLPQSGIKLERYVYTQVTSITCVYITHSLLEISPPLPLIVILVMYVVSFMSAIKSLHIIFCLFILGSLTGYSHYIS
jgi:hypothetical protein